MKKILLAMFCSIMMTAVWADTPASQPEVKKDIPFEPQALEYISKGCMGCVREAIQKLEQIAKKQEEKIAEAPQKAEPQKPKAETAAPTPVVQTAVEIKEEPAAPSIPDAPAEPTERAETLEYRIVGEVFNAYVVVERGESMLLIDKHAAHERIIFEELKSAMRSSTPTSQMLMLPIEVMMTSDEIQTLGTYKEEIEAVGFEFTQSILGC